jgi:flagellar motor switch protein FliG
LIAVKEKTAHDINVESLIFATKKFIAEDPENKINIIIIVLDAVIHEIAIEILSAFSLEVQTEVVAEIQYYKHYDKSLINRVFREVLIGANRVFGGETRAKSIINNVSEQDKKQINTTITRYFPEYQKKIHEMTIVFEDLFDCKKQDLNLIISQIPVSLLATIITDIDTLKKEKIYELLSTEQKLYIDELMSDQWNIYASVDIDNAKRILIDKALKLESFGYIKIKQ